MNPKIVIPLIGAAATIVAALIAGLGKFRETPAQSAATTMNVTSGTSSPVISASGNVTVSYGPPDWFLTEWAIALRRQGSQEQEVSRLLRLVASEPYALRAELERRAPTDNAAAALLPYVTRGDYRGAYWVLSQPAPPTYPTRIVDSPTVAPRENIPAPSQNSAVHPLQNSGPRMEIQQLFTPSGWMGDAEYGQKYVQFTGADRTNPRSPPDSIRIIYTFGPRRWAGMYWQNHPDNWGEKPGTDYSAKGITRLTFWARGGHGGEVVEFKVGGIDSPRMRYRDSLAITLGRTTLTKEWVQYQIDLRNAQLGSLVGGFCWVASADYNRGETLTFFLDDIDLE